MQERLERERIQRLQREKKEKEEELERQRKQRERIEQQRLEMERIEQLRQKEIEQHLQLVNNYRNFVLGPQAQLETRPLEWQPYKRTKDRGKAIVDGWWHCEFWFIDDGTYDHFGFFPLSTHTKRPWEGDQKAQIRPDKKKFLNGYAHNRPLAKTNAQDARLRLAVDTQRANHNEIRYHLDHHDCRHYAWELLHASYLECVRLYQLALPHLSPGEQCLCKDARKY
ncbi:MAG: hypothetical protein EZS28_023737 [Streblomastix strix]|uniref:Uncharacterized protein n=1 Tax=Streblomastix strix TaxID=222440 RepID=A0A5J4VE09_9EUKA|nr:MAG: hypothetical protein EZS28_023737 [Streblomastix strix]